MISGKFSLLFMLLVLFSPLSLTADVFIGTGSFLTLSSVSEPALEPGVYLTGGFDAFAPLSKCWSFFSDGGGRFSFYPGSLDFAGRGYLNGDISYRGNLLFSRFELGIYAEHGSWRDFGLMNNYGEVYISLDYENISLFTNPIFLWDYENGLHSLGAEGSVGFSLGIGSVILSPSIRGGFKQARTEGFEKSAGGEVKLSWYPGIPATVDAEAGFVRIASPYMEEIVPGEDPLPVDSGNVIYWKPEAVFYVGSRMSLDCTLEGSLTIKDHGYIDNSGTVQVPREIRLAGKPGLGLTVMLSERFDLSFEINTEFLYSNSSYLNHVSGTADLSLLFHF